MVWRGLPRKRHLAVIAIALLAMTWIERRASMSRHQSVAVVGGSGTLGRYVVDELAREGFTVSALTRGDSDFPPGVTTKRVDYSSLESLKDALAGHDAVVSTIATLAIGRQRLLVDAAFEVGVKRFIPSEFGINSRALGDATIGRIIAGKIAVVDYLQEKAAEKPSFGWTGLSTGLFFDVGLRRGWMGIDAKKKTATVYDSGNEPFQASNLPFIAKAVVSVLRHPEPTKNKYLRVASFNTSLNEIVKIVEEETGAKVTVDRQSTADLERLGEEKWKQGDYSAFSELLRVHLHRDGAGHPLQPKDSANEDLELPNEDVRATIRAWLVELGEI